MQVSTAVRLCDGALVVVDIVEGVCPQVCQLWLAAISILKNTKYFSTVPCFDPGQMKLKIWSFEPNPYY